MRFLLLLIVASAFAHFDESPLDGEIIREDSNLAPEEDLLSAVKALRAVSDGTPFHVHGMRIEDHANLIQATKAKAYKHSFAARNAIKAAINALIGELNTGHNHDRNALNNERNAGHNAVSNAINRGKQVTRGYREKSCPTKKAQVEAEAARNAAKNTLNAIKRKKVCNLKTTWFDMGIKNTAPKFGAELRNKWDRERAEYVKKTAVYNAAVKAYNKAAREHAGAMSSFKATTRVEASNARSACLNAHKAYNLLAKDVASNVSTRKQVYIASKVISCYVDNLTKNGAAHGCANKARRANTSRWNINPARMNGCLSKAALEAQLGPLTWRPSKKNCHAKHWNERGIKAKERAHKESSTKKEKSHKERNSKHERSGKEKKSKESKTKESQHKHRTNTLRVTRHYWYPHWINGWDAHMNWSVGGNQVFAGLQSVHNNGREDRLFKPLLNQWGAHQANTHWSGWVNNWDAYFAYSCPHNMAIVGMISYHSNHYEDRRWRIRCARYHHINIAKGGWPGWQTNWDQHFHLSCGHRPLVGLSSYHHNGAEDRRWRIQCGTASYRL